MSGPQGSPITDRRPLYFIVFSLLGPQHLLLNVLVQERVLCVVVPLTGAKMERWFVQGLAVKFSSLLRLMS